MIADRMWSVNGASGTAGLLKVLDPCSVSSMGDQLLEMCKLHTTAFSRNSEPSRMYRRSMAVFSCSDCRIMTRSLTCWSGTMGREMLAIPRPQVTIGAATRTGIIDCDLHPGPHSTDEIRGYLPMPWCDRYSPGGRGSRASHSIRSSAWILLEIRK
jgi:hypothetical protein